MGIQERKQRERERRRQQIMVAAKRVFSNKGFGKTTMEDIAAEAEISPGTIYLYFKNKEELYTSLSLRILKYLQILMQHVNSQQGVTTDQRMEALKQALYDVHRFDPLVFLNMFHLQSSEGIKALSPDLLTEIQRLSKEALDAMAEVFREGVAKGEFVELPSITLANILWALFSGIALWEENKQVLSGQPADLSQSFDLAFSIFQKGIRVCFEVSEKIDGPKQNDSLMAEPHAVLNG